VDGDGDPRVDGAAPTVVAACSRDRLREAREWLDAPSQHEAPDVLRTLVTEAEHLRRRREQAAPWCPHCGEPIGQRTSLTLGVPVSIVSCANCFAVLGAQLVAPPQPQSGIVVPGMVPPPGVVRGS